jgi:lysophospholipase L1-like esterase
LKFRFPPRLTPLLIQLIVFVLVIGNLEAFSYYRLHVDGYESGTGIATRDVDRGWRLKREQHPEINSDCIRNPEVVSPRPPGVYRILCLGGSVTFGLGLAEPDTYERVMERALQAEAPPGARMEVINAGTPGYATQNFASLLFDVGERYQPNVVMVMAGFNEPTARPLNPREIGRAKGDWSYGDAFVDQVRRVMQHSATYRYLTRVLLGGDVDQAAAEERAASWVQTPSAFIQASADNLATMADWVHAHGARFIVVFEARRSRKWMDASTQPYINGGRDAYSVAALKAAYIHLTQEDPQIAYLDMDAILHQTHLSDDTLFQPNDAVHPTVLGNQIIAKALTEKLDALGWVPRR